MKERKNYIREIKLKENYRIIKTKIREQEEFSKRWEIMCWIVKKSNVPLESGTRLPDGLHLQFANS